MQETEKASEAPDPDFSLTGCVPFAWYDRKSCSWRTWQRCFIEGWARYAENWPRAGMTRNGIAYRRVPLAPLTGGIGSLSSVWIGTPRATVAIRSEAFKKGRMPSPEEFVEMFPTPYGLSANQGQGDGEFGKAIRNWPTPDCRGFTNDGALMKLAKAAESKEEFDAMAYRKSKKQKEKFYPTPTVNDSKNNGSPSRHRRRTKALNVVVNGQLNPTWVELLMGFPPGWTDLT